MRRLPIPLLLALGAASLAKPASGLADPTASEDLFPVRTNARTIQEMRSRAGRLGTSAHSSDTIYVGFNPAYAGSNYWSIGVGHRRPRGAFGPGKGDIPPVPDDDTGYWDWDHPVHGDSLQGWWPARHVYGGFFVANQADDQRPFHAVDIGNSISYVIHQGSPHRRTYGVTSAWHADPGVNGKTPDPDPGRSDVNPSPPRWTPLAGNMSAWCGLRAHGDATAVDALTGNPYTVDALEHVSYGSPLVAVGTGGTNRRFPGYASQWDQMLYRDVDIGDAVENAPVSVSFRFRTRMSTGKSTSGTTRTGWFDKDPLGVAAGNFISATYAGNGAPIDSFMVYVGCPVADTVGAEWIGSDGATHAVFDPVRRWFGELIRANETGGHYQLFTTYGDDPPIGSPADSNAYRDVVATRDLTWGQLRAAWGDTIRLVFRVKTNRGREAPSADDFGSLAPGVYHSGYLGAAQVDEVGIGLGNGTVPLGDFESESDIDNHAAASALDAWKTSSKPPAIEFHVHDLADLLYDDLCGQPGTPGRVCDMAGNVISMGNHDQGERPNGAWGSADQEQWQGIFSPTINLAFDPGNPSAKNGMGLDGTTVAAGKLAVAYNIYTGFFDIFALGQGWQPVFQSYPAVQSDGTRMWGEPRTSRFQRFNPTPECFDLLDTTDFGEIMTSNPSGVPDSVRIGFRRLSQCWRFGVTTDCGGDAGGYLDNISLVIIDATPPPLSVLPLDFWNDTFPANETPGLPGTAAFDTTAALIKTGRNIAPTTQNQNRYDVPGDTTLVSAPGDSVEVQLVFRILPGPGNYVFAGDRCSGLRRVPSDTTRIGPGDGSFWTGYIENPGKDTGGFPSTGDCKSGGALRHDQRWSELTWCSARCDTAEANLFPIERQALGGPVPGVYASMYHEDDKHLAALGLERHECFLVDTLGPADMANITCSSVPAWVTEGGVPYRTGYDGTPTTVEGTKILPDGLLTPGSHVQYFYVRKDMATGATALCPDTSVVHPQPSEGSLDAHRWQQFGVLPDAWKFASYGGLGRACMLYVDWNDRNGTERAWVSIADSIGATSESKRGAHNGWAAPGGADVNDPIHFVSRNAQPGTTWDMYGVKGADALAASAGTLGARLANRATGTLLDDKWAKNAPTPEMLQAYYRILVILTGDLDTFAITGPFRDRSADDAEMIRQFVTGATVSSPRGLWCMGEGFVDDLEANGHWDLADLLGVRSAGRYVPVSGNNNICIDLIPTPVITTTEDIWGLQNSCAREPSVLVPIGDGQAATYYEPVGAGSPYVAGVFMPAEPPGHPQNHWQSLVEGWDIAALMRRTCDNTNSSTLWHSYGCAVTNQVFGKICAVSGICFFGDAPATPIICPCTPRTGDVDAGGRPFVDLAGLGNNPLRHGSAVIHLALAQADRVTVKIYDVSGRLVRTLANGQLFQVGRVDPALTWDGLDDGGRNVARGAYFVNVRYEKSRYEVARKMIVLR